jgi:hypothetical protein
MSTNQWFLLVGLLMLAGPGGDDDLALAVHLGHRLPVRRDLLGPSFLGIFRFDPWKQSALLEMLTQPLLISLFSAGIKMPVPFKWARWDAPLRLAWISMTLTVAWWRCSPTMLHLPPGAAILLGGILAPTDPVLATDVQVRHPGDKDQLRFTLTCEAGMNDGSAFPSCCWVSPCWVGDTASTARSLRWLLVDVVWATAGAVAVGVFAGAGLARLGWRLRIVEPRHDIMDDLVALGLIAVVYAVASMIKASGYLAVFFAAVALRQTELVLAGAPGPARLMEPDVAKSEVAQDTETPPVVSGESLVFKEHLERLSELTLVLLLGGMISLRELPYETIRRGGLPVRDRAAGGLRWADGQRHQ